MRLGLLAWAAVAFVAVASGEGRLPEDTMIMTWPGRARGPLLQAVPR